MTNFLKSKYQVIKQAISPDIANISYEYLKVKKNIFLRTKDKWPQIIKDNFNFPIFGGDGDNQIQNTWMCHGDTLMETLLIKLKPEMEKITKLELDEQYAYTRLYKKGDTLDLHKDRPECEISTTLNLGGDQWPIYLEPNIKIEIMPGDMLIYKCAELAHCRYTFSGTECAQVFLHYTRKGSEQKYDGRTFLGIPKVFTIK